MLVSKGSGTPNYSSVGYGEANATTLNDVYREAEPTSFTGMRKASIEETVSRDGI